MYGKVRKVSIIGYGILSVFVRISNIPSYYIMYRARFDI